MKSASMRVNVASRVEELVVAGERLDHHLVVAGREPVDRVAAVGPAVEAGQRESWIALLATLIARTLAPSTGSPVPQRVTVPVIVPVVVVNVGSG